MAAHLVLLSSVSFGGFPTVLPDVHAFTVGKGWITDQELADFFAVSQVAPGPNMILMMSFIGLKVGGIPGAIASALATFGPPCTIYYFSYTLWGRFRDRAWQRVVRRGLTPLTIGLVVTGGYVMAGSAAVGWRSVALTAAAAALMLGSQTQSDLDPDSGWRCGRARAALTLAWKGSIWVIHPSSALLGFEMHHGWVTRSLCTLLAVGLLAAKAEAQQPCGWRRPPWAWCAPSASRSPRPTSSSAASRRSSRVALVARVCAFLEKRLFIEGAEVKKGDLLYRLEQPPFQAQVQANQATVAQFEAQHRNAELTLERAQTPVEDAGRPAIECRCRARLGTRAGGADRRRPGAAADSRDQSRLYRDPRADRRQDQPHRGHRRQRRLADQRHPGDDRQPGSDVCALPGFRTRTALDLRDRYAAKGGSARS